MTSVGKYIHTYTQHMYTQLYMGMCIYVYVCTIFNVLSTHYFSYGICNYCYILVKYNPMLSPLSRVLGNDIIHP